MKLIKKINYLLFIIASCVSLYLGFVYIKNDNLIKLLITMSIIPSMLIPYFLNKLLTYKITDGIIMLYTIFIIAAIILGSLYNFYYLIPLFDKIAHFTTGFLFSMFAVIILKNFNKYDHHNIKFNLIFMASITCMSAVLWEIFEYISDYIFDGNAQRVLETGINDTMQDMIAALLGFIIFAIVYIGKKKSNR